MKQIIRSVISADIHLHTNRKIPEALLAKYVNQVLSRVLRKRFNSGRMEQYFGNEEDELTEERIQEFLDSLEDGEHPEVEK